MQWQASRRQLYQNRDSDTIVFPWILETFSVSYFIKSEALLPIFSAYNFIKNKALACVFPYEFWKYFQPITSIKTRLHFRCFLLNFHSVLPPFLLEGNEFLKNCSWGRWLFLLSERGKATFWGKYLFGGDQQSFLKIFIFAILWPFVKEYQIVIKLLWFQKIRLKLQLWIKHWFFSIIYFFYEINDMNL